VKRQLVAVFFVWHAVSMAVGAVPTPGAGLNRAAWSQPTVQAEFALWAARLGTESAALQDGVYDVAVGFEAVRRAANVPFRGYAAWTHTRQGWQMFVAPHRFPTRLQLRARGIGRDWDTIFEEGNPDATWRGERFATERVRASVFAWGWPQFKRRWASACAGFGRDLFADRPELDELQCRYAQVQSPSAAQVLAGVEPEPTWVYPRRATRSAAP